MKKIYRVAQLLLFCIATLWYNITLCQQAKIEEANNSLLKTYANIAADTAAINKEREYAYSLRHKHLDSCLMLLSRVAEKCIRLNYKDGAAFTLMQLGICYVHNGFYDKGIEYYRKALVYTSSYKDLVELAMMYSTIIEPWLVKEQYDSAAFYAYKAAHILQEATLKNEKQVVYAIRIYNNLGTLWFRMQNNENSILYFKKAEAIGLMYKDRLALCRTYFGLAGVYTGFNKDTASYYLQLAEKYSDGIYRQAEICNNWGRLYYAYNQPRKAVPYLIKAINITKGKDPYIMVTCYGVLAWCYFELKDYKKAEIALLTALPIADTINYTDRYTLKKMYTTLSAIYDLSGNYMLAYKWQKKATIIQDSITKAERDQYAYKLEMRTVTNEKNKEIATQRLQIIFKNSQLREKNILIIVSCLGVLFVTVLSFTFYKINKHKQKLQEEQINSLQQEQEIRQLRAAIRGEEKERARIARELHDGVASQLTTVKLNLDNLRNKKNDIIRHSEVEEAFAQLHEATMELRKTAQNLMPDIIIDNGLENAVQIFCNKIQRNSNIHIDYEVFGDLPRLHTDIELSIYRIIQELLQNVLKHAHATHILVQFIYKNKLLSITIEDNGKGYIKGSTVGLGLKNVEERVNMLNGTLTVNGTDNAGTTIYIEFDVCMLLKDKINAH